jgi:hypothetical protein
MHLFASGGARIKVAKGESGIRTLLLDKIYRTQLCVSALEEGVKSGAEHKC